MVVAKFLCHATDIVYIPRKKNPYIKKKKKRRGFCGYKAENVTTTTTQSESMHMQDGEEPILEFCGINREMICCGRSRKFKYN